MKKVLFIFCLLSAFSIGVIFAQPSQSPVMINGNDNVSEYTLPVNPVLPDITPTEMTSTSQPADKLTMVSSPNPFTGRTTLTCVLPSKGKLMLEIRNMFGETVKTDEENVEQEGTRNIEVTSERLRPGIYTAVLTLKTNDNVLTKNIRIVCKQ